MLSCLSTATVLLTSTSVLVMAEEFEQLPEPLKRMSSTLVNNRRSRTAFICGVIILMALASSLTLVIDTEVTRTSNSTTESPTFTEAVTAIESRSFDSNSRNAEVPVVIAPKEIVVNLSLTATIHHNITINNGNFSVVENCGESCIKEIIKEVGLDNLLPSVVNDASSAASSSTNNTSLSSSFSISDSRVKRSVNNAFDYFHVKLFGPSKRAISDKNVSTVSTSRVSYSNVGTINDYNISYSSVLTEAYEECPHPEYIVFTWVLCLVALATALKLYYIIKLFLALVMVGVYAFLIIGPYNFVFYDGAYTVNTDDTDGET